MSKCFQKLETIMVKIGYAFTKRYKHIKNNNEASSSDQHWELSKRKVTQKQITIFPFISNILRVFDIFSHLKITESLDLIDSWKPSWKGKLLY